VSEVGSLPAADAGDPHGFLADPTPFVVDGVEFVSGFGPESTPGRFTVIKKPEMLDKYLTLSDLIGGGVVVELGIARGGSAAWMALVMEPQLLVAVDIAEGRVAALDHLIETRGLERVILPHYGVDQGDRTRLIELVRRELDGRSIDVVIDDASHLLAPTRASFESLFPLVRPGGMYIIEDWEVQNRNADAYAASRPPAEDEYAAAIAAQMRRERVPVPENEPVSRLVIELTLAQATWGTAIDGFSVDKHWIAVRRGTADLDPETFRLRELYVDHFDLDPSSTRPD
jgi:predicted O-methyltransferase YrrM